MTDFLAMGPDFLSFLSVLTNVSRHLVVKGVYDGDGLQELYQSGGIYLRLTRHFNKVKT